MYLPIGVEFTKDFSSNWHLKLAVEYDVFLAGKQKSHLGGTTIENDQDKGYGARASARLSKSFHAVDFFIEPFVRYWDIQDSDSVFLGCDSEGCYFGVEPQNQTLEAGLQMGVAF